ncbi:MAG: helix-turn-helix domain-containing protein [Mesorhizobium sp.]|uniref:GlxA family transcriptional regulator n=1 Tax=Mesorhizobium sp. TaxID=1871066 RepID=UPI000FE80C14|nr:DJ-1/PfpI family protein [Mesorhizobium sp.]RWI54712.1 MAG: helix-turn-helix domain-containing protein [Mesorhizobium sp.]
MRKIVLIAFEGMTALDLIGPLQVFATAGALLRMRGAGDPYELIIASAAGGAVQTSSGAVLHTGRLDDFWSASIDTLIVPGGGDSEPLVPQEVVRWVQINRHRPRRICSVCVGAFILGAAGLLAGRTVTTHWARIEELQQRFPDCIVIGSPIFTRDDQLWTSAGVSAGIDLALHVVEDDLGRRVAMDVAKMLVVPLRRPSGQPQFSATLLAQSKADSSFSDLIDWIAQNLAGDLSVEVLAGTAGMSARSFARKFKVVVGKTPADFVAFTRVEAARSLVEDGALSLKEICAHCGFTDHQHLTREFRRRYNTTPTAYRASFC